MDATCTARYRLYRQLMCVMACCALQLKQSRNRAIITVSSYVNGEFGLMLGLNAESKFSAALELPMAECPNLKFAFEGKFYARSSPHSKIDLCIVAEGCLLKLTKAQAQVTVQQALSRKQALVVLVCADMACQVAAASGIHEGSQRFHAFMQENKTPILTLTLEGRSCNDVNGMRLQAGARL